MFLTGLDRVLNDSGVKWTARPGWATRTAHRGGLVAMRAVMWHTTESSAATFNTGRDAPTLGYVESGLGYNLYNILIGRSGRAYLIAAGTAAHAGKGTGHGLPTNNGNRYSVGISFDANNNSHPVTAAQLETGARLGAAFDREWNNSLRHVMHGEYARPKGRRTDPTKIPGGWGALRSAINRGYWRNAPTNTSPTLQEEDMPLTDDDIRRIWAYRNPDASPSQVYRMLRRIDERVSRRDDGTVPLAYDIWAYKNENSHPRQVYSMLRQLHEQIGTAAGERAGLLKAIEQIGGGDVDLDAIREATAAGVAEALGSLEADVKLTIDTDQED